MKQNIAMTLGALSLTLAFTGCSKLPEDSAVQLRLFRVEGPIVTAESCSATIETYKETGKRRYKYGPECYSPNKIKYDFGSNTRCMVDETPVTANGPYGQYDIENRKANCQKFPDLTPLGQKELQQAQSFLNQPGNHFVILSEKPQP